MFFNSKNKIEKIIIIGDYVGISQLFRHIPGDLICAVVVATNRSHLHDQILSVCQKFKKTMIIQPYYSSPSYQNFIEKINLMSPDLLLINSYSLILRDDLLKTSKWGALNIHGGRLPEYRGSNPTQWSLINSEIESGVTLHEVTSGIDEGNIIARKVFPILSSDTWIEIEKKVEIATDAILEENLDDLVSTTWKSHPQESLNAKYYSRRKPADGLFNWDWPLIKIYNLIRALVAPLPGAFFNIENGDQVKIDYFMSLEEIYQKSKTYRKKSFYFNNQFDIQKIIPSMDFREIEFFVSSHSSYQNYKFIIDNICFNKKMCNLKSIPLKLAEDENKLIDLMINFIEEEFQIKVTL